MSNIVSNPFSYNFDPMRDRNIGLGQAFVGEPGTNPVVESNRKTVTIVQEDGTEVVLAPASQPIDLNAGGGFTYQGSPVQVRVDGNYSQKVLDRNGAQVYFFSDAGIVTAPVVTVTFKQLDTVADMVLSTTLNVGDYVITSGYLSAGDGGDNSYEIVASGTGTDDSGSFIDLTTHQAKGLFPRGIINIVQFGADITAATGSDTATINAMAFGGVADVTPGSYLLTGSAIEIPNGGGLRGPTPSIQGTQVTFSRGAADFNTFFTTDETDVAFNGIVLENFSITGGSSATFSNVANKWAIESHYPFTQIRNIHIEHNSEFFGNGVRLHNDGGSGAMGAWSSEITNVRFVGTTDIPADNGQIAFDLAINGGQVKLDRISGTRSDLGLWVRSGEDVECINCNFDNIRAGNSTNREMAAVIVGEPNSNVKVKSFSFSGYIEGVQRGFVLQNTHQANLSGYMNALRAFAPAVTPDDGFIYIHKTAKNVALQNADIEVQYNGQNVVYSESVYSIEGCRLFRNVTDSNGVPQTRFAGNVFGGTLPARDNVQAFVLDAAKSNTTITGAVASGSEVQITSTAHGKVTGDYVWIEGIVGLDVLINKKLWQITEVDANNFTLDASLFSGTYSSGGNVWTPISSLDGGEINQTAVFDPPSIADGDSATTVIATPGAQLGSFVQASFSLDLAELTLTAYVSSTNSVTAVFQNSTGSPVDLASGTVSVHVSVPVSLV